jgi:hypothetical protein
MSYPEDVKHMEKQWSRMITAYLDFTDEIICSVWADDALTGWVLYIDSPIIQDFDGKKSLAITLEAWLKLKSLGNETVTPVRVVAKGRNLIAKAFLPHVDLKHAVRQGADDRVNILMPIEEFKIV